MLPSPLLAHPRVQPVPAPGSQPSGVPAAARLAGHARGGGFPGLSRSPARLVGSLHDRRPRPRPGGQAAHRNGVRFPMDMTEFANASPDYHEVLYAVREGVGRITLNREAAYNAYSTAAL